MCTTELIQFTVKKDFYFITVSEGLVQSCIAGKMTLKDIQPDSAQNEDSSLIL